MPCCRWSGWCSGSTPARALSSFPQLPRAFGSPALDQCPLRRSKRLGRKTRPPLHRSLRQPRLRRGNVPQQFAGEEREIELKAHMFAMRPRDPAGNAQPLAMKQNARARLRKLLALDECAVLREIPKQDRKRPAGDLQRGLQQHVGPAVAPVLGLPAFVHERALIRPE